MVGKDGRAYVPMDQVRANSLRDTLRSYPADVANLKPEYRPILEKIVSDTDARQREAAAIGQKLNDLGVEIIARHESRKTREAMEALVEVTRESVQARREAAGDVEQLATIVVNLAADVKSIKTDRRAWWAEPLLSGGVGAAIGIVLTIAAHLAGLI